MKRPSRITLACLVVMVLGGLVLLAVNHFLREPEPAYQGKRLSKWLMAFSPATRDRLDLSSRDAGRAIREIGTNAFPTLFRMLRATDSLLKLKLNALIQKQKLIKFRFTTADDLHREAERAFVIMGVRAEAALPDLIKILDEDSLPDSKAAAARIINSLGPSEAASAAVPSLQTLAVGTNRAVASAAANTLGNLTLQSGNTKKDARFDRQSLARSYEDRLISSRDSKAEFTELVILLSDPNVNSYWVRFRLEEADHDGYARLFMKEDAAANTNLDGDRKTFAEPGLDSIPDRDAHPLSVGAWSETVENDEGHHNTFYAVHGRLLLYEWRHGRNGIAVTPIRASLCLELQDLSKFIAPVPASVYFEFKNSVEFQLRDEAGNLVPSGSSTMQVSTSPPAWYTLPPDGSLQLRADLQIARISSSKGVGLSLGSQCWIIPAGDTNNYFLSGTFSQPTNHANPLDYAAWGGTLKLPPVKIHLPKQ